MQKAKHRKPSRYRDPLLIPFTRAPSLFRLRSLRCLLIEDTEAVNNLNGARKPSSTLSQMDATPSIVLTDTPNLVTELETTAEEDDWVVVKKQRIIFLVPPPSPALPQSVPENGKHIDPPKRRRRRRSDRENKTSSKEAFENDTQMERELRESSTVQVEDRIEVSESHDVLVADVLPAPSCGAGNNKVHHKTRKLRPKGIQRTTMGASNVVNIRLRASNFEKKIQRFGGLRKWLVSQRLTRFSTVFDREKLSLYQLVTLTMSKLKDVGVDAVGPRRKLIHAIDCLCQPYYIKPLPMT